MNAITTVPTPALVATQIGKAKALLETAKTIGDVREAQLVVKVAHDMAKQVAKSPLASSEIKAEARQQMGEALKTERRAERRMADEVDMAQERGELPAKGQHKAHVQNVDMNDVGITKQEVSRARKARDFDSVCPNVYDAAVDKAVEDGKVTKAEIERNVSALTSDEQKAVVAEMMRPSPRRRKAKNPLYNPNPVMEAHRALSSNCEEIIARVPKIPMGQIVDAEFGVCKLVACIGEVREARAILTDFINLVETYDG